MAIESHKDERETHLNVLAADRGYWEAASNDPVMIRKLQSIGAQAIRVQGDVCFFRLSFDQVLLRKGKRKVSDTQRNRFRKTVAPMKKNDNDEVE
jgi:hypothetical protein